MEFISVLGDTGFLACKGCKTSVLPSGIDYHFRQKPHQLLPEERENIFSETTKYPYLVWDIAERKEVSMLDSFPYFFSNLALYRDGLAY